jgi:hypothetical protein
MKKHILNIAGFTVAAFGLITLFLSTSVIFDLFGIRAKEGNYVLFVVVANFVSSILYIASSYGFVKGKKWTTILLSISYLILMIAFVALLNHINSGGIYETKTIGAMIFRTSFTLFLTVISYFTITKK